MKVNKFDHPEHGWKWTDVEIKWINQIIVKAKEEGKKEERERLAAWVEAQRNDIPACGFEFAAAIRGVYSNDY